MAFVMQTWLWAKSLAPFRLLSLNAETAHCIAAPSTFVCIVNVVPLHCRRLSARCTASTDTTWP